jgi:hypothetical protein
MNTASRMRVLVSATRSRCRKTRLTYLLPLESRIEAREEKVVAKGKGCRRTGSRSDLKRTAGSERHVNRSRRRTWKVYGPTDFKGTPAHLQNSSACQVECRRPNILKQVHARRDDTNVAPWEEESNTTMVTVLEEVKEIIHLPL